jgi:hypothetical protein
MPNVSNVTIKLGNEEIVLKPSMQVARIVSRQFNGFANARAALVAENFDAVAFIIRHGSGMRDREARDLDDKIFEQGLLNGDLLMQLINFVAMLGNRGQPIQLTDEEENTTRSESE